MQTNIASSIQDYSKKINRSLTRAHLLSIFSITLVLVALTGYVYVKEREKRVPVLYRDAEVEERGEVETRPFGSIKGKTYTFSWCQGSSRISQKNKVYFASKEQAEKEGRTLSKLCQK